MSLAQQPLQDNYKRSFEKGKQEAAIMAARKILAKREDPHFMNLVLYQDLLALEDQ